MTNVSGIQGLNLKIADRVQQKLHRPESCDYQFSIPSIQIKVCKCICQASKIVAVIPDPRAARSLRFSPIVSLETIPIVSLER